jgi:hypothetical protein
MPLYLWQRPIMFDSRRLIVSNKMIYFTHTFVIFPLIVLWLNDVSTVYFQALCGEEILYDMSLVLEYFRDELLEIGEQSKSVLKTDQMPIKEILYKTINHLRNAVLALRPTAMDKNKAEVKIPSSKKFYKKLTKIVLDLKQFIKTCLTIIDLK